MTTQTAVFSQADIQDALIKAGLPTTASPMQPLTRPLVAGGILGGIFGGIEEVVRWALGLEGALCNAYKNGASVDGVQVSIYRVLSDASKALSATPDGKAAAVALNLIIDALNDICGKPAGVA